MTALRRAAHLGLAGLVLLASLLFPIGLAHAEEAVVVISLEDLMRNRQLIEAQQVAIQEERQVSNHWHSQYKTLEACVLKAGAEARPATSCLPGHKDI